MLETETIEDNADAVDVPSKRKNLYDSMVALVVLVMKRVLAITVHDGNFVPDKLEMCEPYTTSAHACMVRLLIDMVRAHTVLPVPARPCQLGLWAFTLTV